MNFPFFIAKRYFSTKENSNFVHLISWVSLLGVAIGTAALILVLSVFNGFEDLVLKMYNSFDPHLQITAAKGKVFNPEKMTIIDCDSQIHQIYEIDQSTDILDLKFSGGGGTSFQPVLDYVSEHPTQALIYFTDLHGETNLNTVDYPVIWVCTSEHAPSNIGETVYIN